MMTAYNLASHKLEVDLNEPYCNRAKLDTGTHCNYRCTFCYYKTKLNDITSFDVIKSRIDYLVECGITEVDLSGGESSIHNNWFDILDYCKSKGLKISCLSNGYKFADAEFMRKSKDAGLDEILFSVHGYDESSHNELVANKHGYKRIIQAIENAHAVGCVVRINCTVTHSNYQHIDNKFVALVKQLEPLEVNFLTLNYWNDASNQEAISYADVTPHIQRAIDQLKDTVTYINVRYTPYCFMRGYEQYVCNYYQHIYDVFDWNIAVYGYDIDPETYKKSPLDAMYAAAKRQRNRTYYKLAECVGCKHYYICDGVEKQVTNVQLSPESGEKITQVNFYRRGFYAAQCSDTNTQST